MTALTLVYPRLSPPYLTPVSPGRLRFAATLPEKSDEPPVAPPNRRRYDATDQTQRLEHLLLSSQTLLREFVQTPSAGLVSATQELLERAQDTLEDLKVFMRTDALTRVANRGAMDRELQRQFQEAQVKGAPFTVMMVDIDHFKPINDRYGHPVGDLVLRKVAANLRNVLRERGEIFRYGGEEFAIILQGATVADVRQMAKQLRNGVSRATRASDPPELKQVYTDRPVTISIGVAHAEEGWPQQLSPAYQHPKPWLELADKALYQAKHQGRNRVYGVFLDAETTPKTPPELLSAPKKVDAQA